MKRICGWAEMYGFAVEVNYQFMKLTENSNVSFNNNVDLNPGFCGATHHRRMRAIKYDPM